MARPSTGAVIENTQLVDPTFALRFSANGKRQYVTLGSRRDGWTPARAEIALQDTLTDVRRGTWQPPEPEPVAAPREVPSFHVFASEWFEQKKAEGGRRGGGLSEKGVVDLEWRLAKHLLPFFAPMRLDAITVEHVDRYRALKVRQGNLGATSINKTLSTLAAILETAVEYDLIDRNVAQGRRRRLTAPEPSRTSLDRAEHITALLDATAELDGEALVRHSQRRALVATLVFAGLRIGEALTLRWGDVDLARGTIRVRAAKTDAGVRTVNIVPVLRDELDAYRARTLYGRDVLVFGSSRGKVQSPSNVRRRVLAKAVERANIKLREAGVEAIPELTPHSLRRTFASLLFAIDETPPYVMAQMGHKTAHLTLAVYARQMNRRDGEPERLKTLVQGAGFGRGSGRNGEETAEDEALHTNTSRAK
jgi:integrase